MAGIDAYTKLMLHCNGDDASTTFTDSSDSAHTVTANGNAQIDTAQSVFGGASGLFDGDADYLSIPDSDDFYYGTGDSTIDFRVRFASLPSAGNYMFIYNQRVDANNVIEFSLYNDSGTYKWSFNTYLSSALKAAITRDTSISTDTWYHIAFVKNGSNLMLFQAGTKLGIDEVDADEIPNIAADVNIGRWSGGGYYLHGWIDEFRVSKGIAQWTENFTPPTEEYSYDPIIVSVPAISCIDTFVSPSTNVVTAPALSSVDTFVAPSIKVTASVPALDSVDTLVAPTVKITASMPVIATYDQFIAPSLVGLTPNSYRREPAITGKHLSLKFQNSTLNSGLILYHCRFKTTKQDYRTFDVQDIGAQATHLTLKIQGDGNPLVLEYMSMLMEPVIY